jgi:hypothetical protein
MQQSAFRRLWGAWTGVRRAPGAALDLAKVGCAAALFVSPWVFELASAPAWNLRACGYAVLTFGIAALAAEAEWEPRANLVLGVWLLAAPWVLDFLPDTTATWLHLAGGGLVSTLSALELATFERNPPWRFRPDAAARGALPSAAERPDFGNRPALARAAAHCERRAAPARPAVRARRGLAGVRTGRRRPGRRAA